MTDKHTHPSAELLQALLDGEIPARERRRLEEHLASCAECSEELATWRLLFEDLDGLAPLEPRVGFHGRVMSGVRIPEAPEALPLAARLKARLGFGRAHAVAEHLGGGVLQDLADGALTARRAARARAHLADCTACASELSGWTTVMAQLSRLDRFAPREGFADRVIAGIPPVSARAAVRRPMWARAVAAAGRLVPRTRRAWAAIAGAAVTPAVTFGLVLWVVFSHATLTPQALASFAFWQLTDLMVTAWSGLVSGGLALARFVGLDALVEAMVGAPLLAGAGVVLYSVAFVVAVRVLYKNLIDSRSVRPRYASASAT